MALTPRLEIRATQSLTLTPQLMQSIRLLQLGHLELQAFVEAELLQNPLLERQEGEPPEATEQVETDDSLPVSPIETPDAPLDNLYPDLSGPELRETGNIFSSGEPDAPDVAEYLADRPTLAAHLAMQAGLILTDPEERLIGQALIDSLDEAGYLTADLGDIARLLGSERSAVETVLSRLQGIEPVGVFARTLRECLAIQLGEKDRLDPLMARLLDNLELLADHDLGGLMRAIGVEREELLEMIGELRALDPRPGLAFGGAPIVPVVPDVFVRRSPGGGWTVELNSEVLPKLLLDRTYYARVSATARSAEEKHYLGECLQTANWLIRSLDQRAQTIVKVASEMVRRQGDFLEHGVARLRPMTLRQVADSIGMHESTVSRITTNKYLSTPRGLFEMKYFFTTGLGGGETGEGHSAEAVRHRIRRLIEAESADAVLSDEAIVEILQRDEGISVARRTVAKYREAMNIPSSAARRRARRTLVGAD